MINRRQIILGLSILPIVPYINTKYKTPPGFEPYERKTSFETWEELPFEDIKSGDIIRRKYEPESTFKVIKTFPEIKHQYYHYSSPAGFTVEVL